MDAAHQRRFDEREIDSIPFFIACRTFTFGCFYYSAFDFARVVDWGEEDGVGDVVVVVKAKRLHLADDFTACRIIETGAHFSLCSTLRTQDSVRAQVLRQRSLIPTEDVSKTSAFSQIHKALPTVQR